MAAPAPAIHADAYREAKLTLLSLQARQQIERTDASIRKVEDALVHLKPDRKVE